ncbi:MAG: GNAT family N-acetyltransferase [Inhella sp.]|jgi:ribosomal-protein-alanine N-acetyltransferase|uniref:GNAT family N-acetyltransferase n=1 Tax=Inhella sp. TaxID=1921806 RepID=UPI0022C3A77D|nr:GNAT family N-acetyltransferase [Inhella sp.]MCZ8234998.1 GNAT family N-acetyltransferase [Inhella sp.]
MDVLLTPRLRLRWFRPDDAEFVLGLINEPAWISGIRDSGVRDVDAARAWAQARLIDPYWQVGHGFWLVERRSDAEPLGLCGLFKRDSLPLPDLGYGLATRHAGQGYAREAARACLAYAQRVLGRDELLAITSPTNGPSMALLEDLGFVREGERVGDDGPTVDWRWRADPPRPQDDAALAADLVRRFWACQVPDADGVHALAALPALCTAEAQLPGPGGTVLSVREFVEASGVIPGAWVAELPCVRLVDDHDSAVVTLGPWRHELRIDCERRWRMTRLLPC